MVAAYLKEELLAREARELGLDESDTIVRRRLAQKMEFLVQDTARIGEPADAELRRLYEAHAEQFQNPARVSFNQIFFRTESAARLGLERIANGGGAEHGDSIMLDREYARVDEPMLAGLFGHEFAGRVLAIEPGKWHGPIASSLGFHLIRVSERQAPQRRSFEEVHAQVLDDWQREQQTKANEQFFATLLKKYDVEVDESVKPLIGKLEAAQ